jgi:hypothetical protein
MKTKTCSVCKEEKSLKLFYFRKEYNRHRNYCKSCYDIQKKEYKQRRRIYFKKLRDDDKKLNPWKFVLKNIVSRCTNKNLRDYRWYGAKGIKCLITVDEIKELWFRDKAYTMKKPSIDRENSKKNYTKDNCRFIEHIENISRARRKPVIQYDLQGNFIREWESILRASKELNISSSNIWLVAHHKKGRTKAGNFKWVLKLR